MEIHEINSINPFRKYSKVILIEDGKYAYGWRHRYGRFEKTWNYSDFSFDKIRDALSELRDVLEKEDKRCFRIRKHGS